MEYASFLDSNKHVMASTRHFGRIMKRRTILKKSVSNKTKRCKTERSHDSFNVYGSIWKDIGVW
jgi:hypothetical protein